MHRILTRAISSDDKGRTRSAVAFLVTVSDARADNGLATAMVYSMTNSDHGYDDDETTTEAAKCMRDDSGAYPVPGALCDRFDKPMFSKGVDIERAWAFEPATDSYKTKPDNNKKSFRTWLFGGGESAQKQSEEAWFNTGTGVIFQLASAPNMYMYVGTECSRFNLAQGDTLVQVAEATVNGRPYVVLYGLGNIYSVTDRVMFAEKDYMDPKDVAAWVHANPDNVKAMKFIDEE